MIRVRILNGGSHLTKRLCLKNCASWVILIKDYEAAGYYVFSKNSLSSRTLGKMAADGDAFSVTLDDLYR